MKIGIVGLPNVGKSTLFKALTRKQVDISNYPFCTIDPNVGVVSVPDERLDKLAEMSQSEKIIPAVIDFIDIAGIVRGANKGEGLGNQFLANIREVDAIAHVVRSFANSKIIHVEGDVNPQRDIDIINIELALKDLESVEKRMSKSKKDPKEAAKEKPILEKLKSVLLEGIPLSAANLSEEENHLAVNLQLLTIKSVIYVINGSWKENHFKDNSTEVDLLTEAEMADLSKEEAIELRGEEESKLNQLIRKAYEVLGYITFLTTGEKETRAWQIAKGSIAPQAAGAIHTDFEKGFIKAETIFWSELLEIGSWQKARELGKIRSEGKGYNVRDGDVMEFKVNR